MEQVHSAFHNPVSVSRARPLTRVTIDMEQLEFVALGVLKNLMTWCFFVLEALVRCIDVLNLFCEACIPSMFFQRMKQILVKFRS